MCGIVGYIGNGNVYDILIKGLHRLEYRGYDSAGIALEGTDASSKFIRQKEKLATSKTTARIKTLTQESELPIPVGQLTENRLTVMHILIIARMVTLRLYIMEQSRTIRY